MIDQKDLERATEAAHALARALWLTNCDLIRHEVDKAKITDQSIMAAAFVVMAAHFIHASAMVGRPKPPLTQRSLAILACRQVTTMMRDRFDEEDGQ